MSQRDRLAAICLFLGLGVAAQTPNAGLLSRLEWRSVGPYIGGRVVAVAGVPGNRDLYYMGTTGGGIWKSTNAGLSWQNISDGKLPSASPSIGAIAVAPSNPRVIYAGTGESDIRNDMIPGDGVYRSSDGGVTWAYAGLRDTHSISALAVDPGNPDVVYVASLGHVFAANPERGVFKTSDGGKTWKRILFVDDQTGAINVVLEPNHPEVLYAAMWQAQRTPWSLNSGGPGSGLYKSTDGGAHWTNLTHNPGFPAGVLGRIGVGVTAADPNVVYAMAQAKEGGVFRSNDAGATWRRVNSDQALRQRAFYYMSIYPDPRDANTAYVPEVDALWVTHDGGKTFRELHTPHGDNHIVWINPNNTRILLEGNDGGATVSTDAGLTWSDEHNQPTGQFYHVNLDDQFPYHIYGAQQDEGSVDGPSASAGGSIALGDWKRVAYGESTWVVPQPDNPNITYGSGYFSIFMRYDLATGQFQSVGPWPYYREGSASNALEYRFGWTHPILFSPVNPKELLIGAQYVVRSDDYGQTWRKISPDLTRNEAATELPSGGPVDLDQSGAEIYPGISALAVSPADGDVIWAGSDDGLIHVTTDAGANWTAVQPAGLPEHAWISSIEPDAKDRASAYLTAWRYMWDDFKPYVYVTHNLGQSWQPLTTGLPADAYAFAIRQDPAQPDLLFLGAGYSIYTSFDSGAHWQPLTRNLPPAQVRDIAINNRQGQVVVATHGRAFWVLDDLPLLEQLARGVPTATGGTRLFAPATAWLSHAYGGGGRGGAAAGTNPAFGATVYFELPGDYSGTTPATLTFSNSEGQVVRSFDLHLRSRAAARPAPGAPPPTAAEQLARLTAAGPGMNRFLWDLRYPPATEVTGFHPPAAAGGLDDTVDGPVVTPGNYTATLDNGGQKSSSSFQVALDPGIHASADDLQAELDLQLKIHSLLDGLDRKINQAIATRQKLESGTRNSQSDAALEELNQVLGDMVQLKIVASEGSLLYETKLRSHIAYLAASVALAYARPTAAQYAVFDQLTKEAAAGQQRLDAAIAAAGQQP